MPENGVSGTAANDTLAAIAGTTSNSVDFYPFRSGNQGDPFNGEYALTSAPFPVDDAKPSVTLSAAVHGPDRHAERGRGRRLRHQQRPVL